jgi:hypothetical protein
LKRRRVPLQRGSRLVANARRKLLLGHKSDHVTTHYSAPEIGALIKASERVCNLGSGKSPALAIVRPSMELLAQLTARGGLKPKLKLTAQSFVDT